MAEKIKIHHPKQNKTVQGTFLVATGRANKNSIPKFRYVLTGPNGLSMAGTGTVRMRNQNNDNRGDFWAAKVADSLPSGSYTLTVTGAALIRSP